MENEIILTQGRSIMITVQTKRLKRFYSARSRRHVTFSPKICSSTESNYIEKQLANRNYLDCMNFHQNQSSGCIPPLYIRIERDFKRFGYELCNNEILLDYQARKPYMKMYFNLLAQKCHDTFQDNCEDLSIELHQYSARYTVNNTTSVNIIPKYTINFNYQEQLITDFMDLFYNLGGIVGMWVGWSVTSITYHTVTLWIFF